MSIRVKKKQKKSSSSIQAMFSGCHEEICGLNSSHKTWW
jgi:hypothetical protein